MLGFLTLPLPQPPPRRLPSAVFRRAVPASAGGEGAREANCTLVASTPPAVGKAGPPQPLPRTRLLAPVPFRGRIPVTRRGCAGLASSRGSSSSGSSQPGPGPRGKPRPPSPPELPGGSWESRLARRTLSGFLGFSSGTEASPSPFAGPLGRPSPLSPVLLPQAGEESLSSSVLRASPGTGSPQPQGVPGSEACPGACLGGSVFLGAGPGGPAGKSSSWALGGWQASEGPQRVLDPPCCLLRWASLSGSLSAQPGRAQSLEGESGVQGRAWGAPNAPIPGEGRPCPAQACVFSPPEPQRQQRGIQSSSPRPEASKGRILQGEKPFQAF
ncbi:collagen alpha-1(I) chain-like isoform X2 [Monodelphis domestica]|uniref:collagen alpha-1(I) chain-like isoform X2 n=1 Tax=Monodelphis domestica TaxID=13616 RepID=UPI0024E1DF7E|nr:collagen alpha-1(I) chain-like isoform X2 [Monodelphis domestica]XP_056677116.1 collagen alpha-1(I) chain-like isoform X2 [Monodelphis domestica]